MTLSDILGNIKNLGTKAIGTIGDWLSSPQKTAVQTPAVKTVASMFPTTTPKASPFTAMKAPAPFDLGAPKPIELITPEQSSKIQADIKTIQDSGKAATQQISDKIKPVVEAVETAGSGIAKGAMALKDWMAGNFKNNMAKFDSTPQTKADGTLETPAEVRHRTLTASGDMAAGFVGSAPEAVNALAKASKPIIAKLVESVNPEEIKAVLSGLGAKGERLLTATEDLVKAKTKGAVKRVLKNLAIDTGNPVKTAVTAAEGQGATKIASTAEKGATKPVGAQGATQTLYHGTSAPDFSTFKGDVTYLTDNPAEAKVFSTDPILGGGRGAGTPRVLTVSAPVGKTKDISAQVTDAIMNGDNLDELISAEAKKAKKAGYEYVSFDHPSSVDGSKDFKAMVSVNPEKLALQTETKAPVKNTGILSAVRYSKPGYENTDAFRGGTWYATPESKTYNFTGEGPKAENVGGQIKTTKDIPIKKPLVIKNASLEDGSFAVVNNGMESKIPKESAALADELWSVTHDSEISTGERYSKIADILKRNGNTPQEIRAIVPSNNMADAAMDMVITKGLKERGYDALILENEYKGKVIDKHILKIGSGTVPRETPTGVDSAKSVADILASGENGGKGPNVPRKTTTGPVPNAQPPERKFITRTKVLAPEAAPLLKGEYARRSTEDLVKAADALIAKDPAKAMTVAKTGTDDQAVAVASRLLDNLIGQAKIAADDATKTALYEKAAEVANSAAANLTEHGRAIQAATILGKLTPEGMVRWAAGQIQKYNEQAGARTLRNFLGGAKKIPELTAEQAGNIAKKMEAITKLTDLEAKAQAFASLQKDVKNLVPSSLYAKIIALWKAGLLTGIKTTGLNISSNASHAISETIKDVPAAIVDKVASLFTGQRTLSATTKGTISGVKEGIVKGWRFLRTGYDERDALGKIDFHQVNFGKGPIAKTLQTYEESVFKLLGAEDQPFYYGAKARSLSSQAIATAKNEGLKGKAFASRVTDLIANPTDQMLKYAVMDAQTAVFQNNTALGKVAKALQRAPGGEIVLPFGKTPAAVATQLINYTPFGIVKTIIENVGKGRFDQRLFSQGIGRGMTGTGVLAIGASLFDAGLMTTSRPTSEKEQKQWQLEGKSPNSVKIGGVWRNVGVLGPLGMVLAVGANMQQGFKETGSFIGGLGAAAAGIGSSLTQQTFLYGINQAINALNDPAHYGASFIKSLVGSIVPTIVADVARATDTTERSTFTTGERLTSRIPGLREFLQPQVDTFGNRVETPGFFTVMADPTRPANATAAANDPVVKELRRLDDAGYNVTPTMLGGTNGFKSLDEKQNTQLWTIAGQFAKQKIQEVMANPQYQKWDDEKKSKEIAKKVDESKTEARAREVYYATKGLTGKALTDKLSTFKDDKLMTKAVYTRYNSIMRFGK